MVLACPFTPLSRPHQTKPPQHHHPPQPPPPRNYQRHPDHPYSPDIPDSPGSSGIRRHPHRQKVYRHRHHRRKHRHYHSASALIAIHLLKNIFHTLPRGVSSPRRGDSSYHYRIAYSSFIFGVPLSSS